MYATTNIIDSHTQSLLALALFSVCEAASYRTIGSSGCAAQMVFVPPYTDTVVFLDKYVSKTMCGDSS